MTLHFKPKLKLLVIIAWLLVVTGTTTVFVAYNRVNTSKDAEKNLDFPKESEQEAAEIVDSVPPANQQSDKTTTNKTENNKKTEYPSPPNCNRYYFVPTSPKDGSAQTEQFVEDYHEHLYKIYGHTRAQLLAQLSSCNPTIPGTDRRGNGLTWLQMNWWYWNKIENNRCVVDRIKIRQTTDIAYPTWDKTENTPQENDLSLRWDNFNNSIRVHEQGHRKHGYEVRDEAIALFNSFPSFPTCAELDSELVPKINTILNKLSAIGQAYDSYTNYGVTQLISPHILW